jgi:hypothetical protein
VTTCPNKTLTLYILENDMKSIIVLFGLAATATIANAQHPSRSRCLSRRDLK